MSNLMIADKFAKAIAVFQILWFLAQMVARGIQRLPITLLELATITIITCTGATFFFWFHKPLNVEIPTALTTNATIAEILKDGGEEAQVPFQDTSLDFVEPLSYTSYQMPFNSIWGVQQRPLPRIPNDRDTRLHSFAMVVLVSIQRYSAHYIS